MSSVSIGPVEGKVSISQGQRLDEDILYVGLVTDVEKDVAISEHLEKITVSVLGQRQF